MEAHDKLIAHIEKYSKKPASSQLMNVIAALKSLGAKKILAVNKDPEAPIMTNADYAVVGDLFEVLPAISAEVRRMRGA